MQKQFQTIDNLLKKRQIKRAEILIARHLRSNLPPYQHGAMLTYRARTKLLNGRPEGAIDDLHKVRALSPEVFNTPTTLELLADCHFGRFELSVVGFAERNDTLQAQRLYEQVLADFPDYPNRGWVLYQLGRVHLTNANIEAAVICFHQALLSPSHISALTAYCYERLGFVAFYEERSPGSALNFLNKAIDTYPAADERVWLVQVHILRARVLREMHQLDAAYDAAVTGLKIAANGRSGKRLGLAEALLTAGELLAGIAGRERELVNHLEQFLQISRRPLGVDVTWSRVYEMLGDAYLALGRYEEAVTAYNGVLQHNPYHPWEISIHYRIGRAYYQQGNYEQAVAAIQRTFTTAEKDGQSVDYRVYDIFASALFALGRYDQAAEAYANALRTAPSNTSLDKLRQYHQFSLDLLQQQTL